MISYLNVEDNPKKIPTLVFNLYQNYSFFLSEIKFLLAIRPER